MAGHLKIFAILWMFVLVQTTFAYTSENTSNSVESSEEDVRRNSSPAQKLFIYTFEHFVPLGKNFSKNIFDVSQLILKDTAVTANTKSVVVEFKNNLTQFVHKYETSQSHIYTEDILDIYNNMTHFDKLPQDQITPETTFISETLNKYNVKTVIENFVKGFGVFRNEFVKLFEENKGQLAQVLQDWYKDFNTLTVFQQQFNAVSNFLKMA